MPHFDQNPLGKLLFQAHDADEHIDLCGLAHDRALAIVEDLLARPDVSGSYLIVFDAAEAGGRETLFQPLGRRLLEARRAGVLSRCLPTADGTAYFIAFPTAS